MTDTFLSDRQNLELMNQLGDKSAQGRACGNLGNTHYLLGNFSQAVAYHEDVSTRPITGRPLTACSDG